MYLRHTTRTKDGKTHVYWRLVRSVRHGRKVVQETVAQLGELDAEGRARAHGRAARTARGGRRRAPGWWRVRVEPWAADTLAPGKNAAKNHKSQLHSQIDLNYSRSGCG